MISTSLILAGLGVLALLAVVDALRSGGSSTLAETVPTTPRLSAEQEVVTAPNLNPPRPDPALVW